MPKHLTRKCNAGNIGCALGFCLTRASSNHLFRLRFNFALGIHKSSLLQFLDSSACLAGIFRFKDDFQFFKRDTLRLDIKEVDEDELENVPEHEEDIKPISNLLSKLA